MAYDLAGALSSIYSMLIIVCVGDTLIFISTKLFRFSDALISENKNRKTQVLMAVAGAVVGILTNELSFPMLGSLSGIGHGIIVFLGIIGGPLAGIVSGAAAGAYRMSGLGWSGLGGEMNSWLAVPSAIGLFGAGMLGSILHRRLGIRSHNLNGKKIAISAVATAGWRAFTIVALDSAIAPFFSYYSSTDVLLILGSGILLPELIGNSVGIAVFLLVVKDIVDSRRRKDMRTRLIKKYEEYIGPVARTIAKEVDER
jgi:LytS/YehU family sensor histidine kinase